MTTSTSPAPTTTPGAVPPKPLGAEVIIAHRKSHLPRWWYDDSRYGWTVRLDDGRAAHGTAASRRVAERRAALAYRRMRAAWPGRRYRPVPT